MGRVLDKHMTICNREQRHLQSHKNVPATVIPSAAPLAFSISPDIILVGLAGGVLVGIGILQRSLGDVMKEEAQLPPAAGAAGRRQSQRSKRFLKRNTPPRRPF